MQFHQPSALGMPEGVRQSDLHMGFSVMSEHGFIMYVPSHLDVEAVAPLRMKSMQLSSETENLTASPALTTTGNLISSPFSSKNVRSPSETSA